MSNRSGRLTCYVTGNAKAVTTPLLALALHRLERWGYKRSKDVVFTDGVIERIE